MKKRIFVLFLGILFLCRAVSLLASEAGSGNNVLMVNSVVVNPSSVSGSDKRATYSPWVSESDWNVEKYNEIWSQAVNGFCWGDPGASEAECPVDPWMGPMWSPGWSGATWSEGGSISCCFFGNLTWWYGVYIQLWAHKLTLNYNLSESAIGYAPNEIEKAWMKVGVDNWSPTRYRSQFKGSFTNKTTGEVGELKTIDDTHRYMIWHNIPISDFGSSSKSYDIEPSINTEGTDGMNELKPAYSPWHYDGGSGHPSSVSGLILSSQQIQILFIPKSKMPGNMGSTDDPNSSIALDPINIANGNLYSIHQDMSISAKGLPLDFTRTYNSRDDYDGAIGYGWTHSYDIKIIDRKYRGVAKLIEGDGAEYEFVKNEGGTHTSPKSNYSTLVRNADDTYTLTEKHGTKYSFTSNGRLTSIIDRNSNTQTLTYSGDLLTQITDSSGKSLAISCNADNRISTVTDPEERTVAYDYDADGNLISVTDPDGNTTTYEYDEYHNLIIITDPEGHSSHFTHDIENDRCESFSYDNDINKVTLSYDPENMKTTVTNSKGNASIYEYNNDGVVTKITDPEGNERSWTWDENINRTSATDANGNTTYFEYDDSGNLTKIKDPKNHEIVFAYEENFDMCASITDALSQVTSYTYDVKGNLIQVENAGGDATVYTYDSSGNLLSTTDANEHTTQYEYDSYGNLIKVIDPLNNETQFEYDILSNCTKLIDAKGNETEYTYDNLNRLTQITYPDNSIVKYAYDKVGNRTSVTDPLDKVTNYTYDPANKLLEVIDALQNKTIYSYDTEGNRTSVEDAKNNVTTYEYDSLNRLVKAITTSGTETVYSYDGAGNRISITDANGKTTVYEYDGNNRLIKTGVLENIENVRTWDTQADYGEGIGKRIDRESNPGSIILRQGLLPGSVAYWCMDEDSWSGILDEVIDSSENENHGTAQNGVSTIAEGKIGRYASFDGIDDYVSCGNDASLDLHQEFTLAGWIKVEDFPSRGSLVYKGHPSTYGWSVYGLWISSSNGLYFFISSGSSYQDVVAHNVMNINQWHHVAAVQDSSSRRIYVDGLEVANESGVLTPGVSSDVLWIGGTDGDGKIKGAVDEVGIYNRALSAEEIQSLYTEETYYALSGSIILDYDAGSAETFSGLDIVATEPEGTEIKARIKVTNTLEDLEGTPWSGWYSNFPTNFVKTGKYARVEVSLSTQDRLVTPVLESISLSKINLSSPVVFTYDELGRRTSMTDTIGTTTYAYDNLNRLLSVVCDLSTVGYTYDAIGNRISMTDQNEGVTQYQYDELNRLISLTAPDGKVTNYSYDSVSNLTNMSLPNNTQVNYQFDNLNRLINLTNKKNTGDEISSFGYDYNLAGMRNKITLADGSYVNYSYDDVNRLTEEAKYNEGNSLIYSNDYEFDSVGNRLSKTNDTYGETTYTYNSENQLIHESRIAEASKSKKITIKGTVEDATSTKVTVNGVNATVEDGIFSAEIELSPGENTVTVIAEDAAGNKTSKSITLKLVAMRSIAYSYDNNGNLRRKDDSQGATDYSWDNENRLVGVDYSDGTSDEYVYDGVGKRIQVSEDGNVTNYLYDGLSCIIEQDGSGLTTASYVRGLGYGGGIGSVISKQRAGDSKQYYYYDGIGNVVNVADNAGSVTQEFIYDAYGNILNGAIPSPHGFSTKEYSNRSGLIHFGARLYDPSVGRFISKDPLGMVNGPNLYAYVNNNPVNLVDPYGLCAKKIGKFVSWIGKDAKAMIIGLTANVGRIAYHGVGAVYETGTWDLGAAGEHVKGFVEALIPAYDWHGGPGWGNTERTAITALGRNFRLHDIDYGNDPAIISREVADKRLIGHMWGLGFKDQPGPFGQLYRILATPTFGVKLLFD